MIRIATVGRWARTLSTMFAAGVPLVEAMDSVAGAAGNHIYFDATKKIQIEVSTGSSLVDAMTQTNVFSNMVLQMVAIGEESGSLDSMLSKIADFFEPVIIVVLCTLIGGMVVAMYLPIFKMGQVVG